MAATRSGSGSYVEAELRDVHEVLQVEDPAQVHLDRERQHDEGEVHADEKTDGAHLLVEAPEHRLREYRREQAHVQRHEGEPEDLAEEPEVRHPGLEDLDPDDLGQVDVVQRHELVDVPELVGSEEVPVRAAQERAEHDQDAPEDEEADEEDRDLPFPLPEREVTVPFRVRVDVGDGHEPDDDERRQDDARHPRVVVDEDLLEPEEVPGRLRRVGRVARVRRLLERRLQHDRPHDHHGHDDDEADELDVNEVRPGEDLLGRVLALDRRAPLRDALVVLVGLVHRPPEEEADEEDHPDDRDVVGQRRHLVEVRIEVGEREEQDSGYSEDDPALLRPERLPVDGDDEQDERDRDEILRRREEVDDALQGVDDRHRARLSPALDGSGDAAVLADAPEVHGHEERRDERDPDAVEDVEPQERAGSDEANYEQRDAGVVRRGDELDVADLEQAGARTLDPEERSGRGHVRSDRDRPDRELVPREEIPGEREQQGEHEQNDADDPVELAGRLVGAGHEDAEHVDPDGDDHRVRAPAVHFPHDAEGDLLSQVEDVDERVLDGGAVIEHEEETREGQDEEEEERDPARAPRVAHLDAGLARLDGVQVEHHVAEHREHALAVRVRDADPEDGLPELALDDGLLKPVPATTQKTSWFAPGSDPFGIRPPLSFVPGSDPFGIRPRGNL